jgi:hypothetical protein
MFGLPIVIMLALLIMELNTSAKRSALWQTSSSHA